MLSHDPIRDGIASLVVRFSGWREAKLLPQSLGHSGNWQKTQKALKASQAFMVQCEKGSGLHQAPFSFKTRMDGQS